MKSFLIHLALFLVGVPASFAATSVSSISPPTSPNLGIVSLVFDGTDFQDGALVSLRHGTWVVAASTCHAAVPPVQMTATFNLAGLVAATWDVNIENPDQTVSFTPGIFSITNASSTSLVSISAMVPGQRLTMTDPTGGADIDLTPGALDNARFYLSADPLTAPLSTDPALVDASVQAAAPLILIPGTMKAVDAYTITGRYIRGLNAPATISISYPDANGDGIVDNLNLNTSALQLMTLDENSLVWSLLPDSAVDPSSKRVRATLYHFSVYALFGSVAQPTLDNAFIFPNPWKRGSGGRFDASKLTFSKLTQAGIIQIYSLEGSLVKQISYDTLSGGNATWDGLSENGSKVVSGVYLVHIKPTSGTKKILKLGIER